jgi:uncharacterized RmlC-like cupin family protein
MDEMTGIRPERKGDDERFHKGPFHLVHAKGDADFVNGLRPYFKYRDLGMTEATGGKLMAQVIRPTKPCDGPGDQHYHVLDFQMVYVLRGWTRVWQEGVGEIRMEAGTCMYQTPGIEHRVLEYSDDYEVLEITVPADFKTIQTEP